MIFGLWTANGALNSKPVFEALQIGLNNLGHTVKLNQTGDIDVIWSVLWRGRMQNNKSIYETAKKLDKPVLVLEVGGLYRGKTWRVGLNGINRNGYFGSQGNDSKRADKLNLSLHPWNSKGDSILIACQHKLSGQWAGNDFDTWLVDTVRSIKKHTDRQIIIRSHPRYPVSRQLFANDKQITTQIPKKIPGTYDDYDFKLENIFAVFNYSSNPGINAAIQGIPVFVSPSSLAWDVSNKKIENLNKIEFPDRQQWLNDLAYTEWNLDEIATGFPILRLTDNF